MSNEISSVAAKGQQFAAQVAAPEQHSAASGKNTANKVVKAPVVQFDPEVMRHNLKEAISHLNDQAQRNSSNLSFRLDQEANRFVITVKNSNTGEVVRQIPDEVVLKVAHNIEQVKGLLLNKKV